MSEKITIDVDVTEGVRKVDALDKKIQETKGDIKDLSESTKDAVKESFNEVMGMMRASYMMVTGIAQVIGGDMGQIFSSMYGIAMAAIGTWQSIASAMAASGVGTVQAVLMTMSLITAVSSLVSVMTGQDELSRRMSGLNMALHGFGQSISSWGL